MPPTWRPIASAVLVNGGAGPLTWQVLHTDAANLWRASVLLTGNREAILIDSAFTLAAGRAQVHAVQAAGRHLKAIVLTCSDPDYYFSLGAVRKAFPNVPVLAPPAIVAMIEQTAAHKVETWRDTPGYEGPKNIDEVVFPAALKDMQFELEGHLIEVMQSRQPGHFHLWLPTERAILGGVQIGSGIHVWMSDARSAQARDSWLASLDDMAALDPLAAPPGHTLPGAPTGMEAIRFTGEYIRRFMVERQRAASSRALISAMKAHYPTLALDWILAMGAEVHFGERQWP